MSLRDKARLNICIAKDLADSFGGRKADYLIPLNRKLRMKITGVLQISQIVRLVSPAIGAKETEHLR
jgi:hypothetical protein